MEPSEATRDPHMGANDEVPRTGSHWIRFTILALIPILIVAGAGTIC